MEIRWAKESDLDNWMELVEQVKNYFPGLETKESIEEHKITVLEFIKAQSAVCAIEDQKIVGILLFSKERSEICFLAVDCLYRRRHIARKMVNFMLMKLEEGKEVTVITYREEDSNGASARAFYKQMGFLEGKLTEEFGYPVQEFILKRELEH